MTSGSRNGPARLASQAACILIGALTCLSAVAQDAWRFEGAERVVAVSDIHGAYSAFEKILDRAGLIDASLDWQGGTTHLVIVGDVLDRGPESRRALDLIRRLETQAAAAGGQVHLVLGNHEIMNMTGDLRYVSPAEFEAFTADEDPAVRDAEFGRFAAAFDGDAAEARSAFDAAYPAGYFGHREAFSRTGVYGRWLLEKPVLLVINDVAFVHGGLAEGIVTAGADLDRVITNELMHHLDAFDALVAAGLVSRTVSVYDLPAIAEGLLANSGSTGPDLSAELEAAAAYLSDTNMRLFVSPDGPVWYRGNVGCNRLTETDRLAAALAELGVKHLVVGHTPAQEGFVLSRMDEMLLRVDTGMLSEYYGGRASALIFEGDEIAAIYEDEDGRSRPLPQPRRVGIRPGGLSAEALEKALASAEVTARQGAGATLARVTLAAGDLELQGLFMSAGGEAFNAAVAAYRLDRLLGLDMVPVTVAREIDGVSGALQLWPADSISEVERSAERLGSAAWCPLGDQFADMYLFDALIYNEARTPERIRYSTDNFGLMLIANDVTFSTARDRPAYLADVPVELTPAWREALEALDEKRLTDALGDVLDRRRIRALLARRDELLELAQ